MKKEPKLTTDGKKKWVIDELRQARTKRAIKKLALLVLSRGTDVFDYKSLTKQERIIIDEIAKERMPTQKEPTYTLYRLLREKEVKMAVNDEVKKQFNESDLNEKWVADNLKKIAESALVSNELEVARKTVNDVAKYLDLEPKQESKQLIAGQQETYYFPEVKHEEIETVEFKEIKGAD